jgi:hypothetical protein
MSYPHNVKDVDGVPRRDEDPARTHAYGCAFEAMRSGTGNMTTRTEAGLRSYIETK